MRLLFDVLFCATGLAWLRVAWRTLLGSRALPDLSAATPPPDATPPSVAVIVAARDAADELEGTLDALLAQQGVALTVIAVDDRSSDRTPALLAAHAARDDRLRRLRIDALPDDWLGKVHACHRGQELAGDHEWLLFVDADSHLAPTVVARAVQEARRLDVQHLCLCPGFVDQTPLGRGLVVSLSIGLFLRAHALARRSTKQPFGVGAFTLIRRDVYHQVGGHDALRLNVLEDCDLAGNVLRRGHGSALRMAVDDFHVRWITDVPSAFRVLEKNFFALLRFRTATAIAVVLAEVASWTLPVWGLVDGGAAGLFAGGCYLTLIPVGVVLARRYRSPLWCALTVPLLFPLLPLLLLRSVVVTLRQGGVRWRETFYPLERLRAASRG